MTKTYDDFKDCDYLMPVKEGIDALIRMLARTNRGTQALPVCEAAIRVSRLCNDCNGLEDPEQTVEIQMALDQGYYDDLEKVGIKHPGDLIIYVDFFFEENSEVGFLQALQMISENAAAGADYMHNPGNIHPSYLPALSTFQSVYNVLAREAKILVDLAAPLYGGRVA